MFVGRGPEPVDRFCKPEHVDSSVAACPSVPRIDRKVAASEHLYEGSDQVVPDFVLVEVGSRVVVVLNMVRAPPIPVGQVLEEVLLHAGTGPDLTEELQHNYII